MKVNPAEIPMNTNASPYDLPKPMTRALASLESSPLPVVEADPKPV